MKKLIILLVLVLVMTGCSSVETFEKIEDVYSPQENVSPAKISILLPEEGAITVMEGETGKIYICSDFDVTLQTLPAGDIEETMKILTGYTKDALMVMQTMAGSLKKYESVWSGLGEEGEQVGRLIILDDGNYHYCLTVMSAAENAGSLQAQWQAVIDSFMIA